MKKRITSLLLTLAMLLSLVPALDVTASAAEEGDWTEVGTYEELYNAFRTGKSKIRLKNNINTSSMHDGVGLLPTEVLDIPKDKDITLDLNGKTLTLKSDHAFIYYLIKVQAGGSLTIQSTGERGTLNTIHFGSSRVTNASIMVGKGGNLTVDNVTIAEEDPLNCQSLILSELGNVSIRNAELVTTKRTSSDTIGGKYCLDAQLGNEGEDGQVTITDSKLVGVLKLDYEAVDASTRQTRATLTNVTMDGDIDILGNRDPSRPWYYPIQINSGTVSGDICLDYHYRYTDFENDGFGQFYENHETQAAFDAQIDGAIQTLFGPNSVVSNVTGKIFTAMNAGELYKWSKYHPSNSVGTVQKSDPWCPLITLPVTIYTPDQFMKEVTLDDEKIEWGKDWKSEVHYLDNGKDHNLTFTWDPLPEALTKAGVTYDAYLKYQKPGSSEWNYIASRPENDYITFTLPKDYPAGFYGFDLILNLKDKEGKLLGASFNEHIVRILLKDAPEEPTAITAVNLTVPELNAGDTTGAAVSLNSSAPAGSCTAGTTWNIPGSGAEESATYYATVTLTAKDGYAFGSGTAVNLTGDHVSQAASISGDGKTMTVRIGVAAKHVHSFGPWTKVDNIYHKHTCTGCNYSEQETHNWVVDEETSVVGTTFYKCSVCGADGGVITSKVVDQLFIGITHPIDGDLPDGDPSHWAKIYGPGSCMDNASIKSVQWYELDGVTPVTSFEAGKRYSVSITFEAHVGYQFVEPESFITDARDFEVGTKTRSENGMEMTVVYTLLEEKPVQRPLKVKVKLPSLNDQIGQAFPEGELVDAPAGITLSGGFLPSEESGTVQADKEYLYMGGVTSDDELDSVSVVIVDEGDAVAVAVSGGFIMATYHTPDPNKITSVALHITAPQYGAVPATTATGDDDALYTVGTPEWSPSVTTFGTGSYTVSIPVTAVGSYSFAENCLYTINGYAATYADGKVSFTFPALKAPHAHDTAAQPWKYLDPGGHAQTCTMGDDFNYEDHTFGSWAKVDENTHSRTCSKCKMSGGSDYTETANHNWKWVVDTAPTLTQEGKQHEECADCSATRNEGTAIPKLESIQVQNLTVLTPVKGEAPVMAGTTDTTDAAYYVAATEWLDQAGSPVGDTFQSNTVYSAKITLEAVDGGVFSANSTYNAIGGKNPVVSPTLTGNASADTVVLIYTFDKTGSDSSSGGGTTGGGGGGGVTTYAITVKDAKNGDVTASHKSAAKGTTVTLTVKPDKGYELDTLTVLDSKNQTVKLTPKDGKFTFTMPASAVTVKAAFKAEAPVIDHPFTDVPEGSWYEDAVIWAVDKGITAGTSATTFSPDGICTRAQAVTFLWRAAGSPEPKTNTMPFTDVKADSYYHDAVLWAVEQGITAGTSATTFAPDLNCSRAQIVTFLYRAAGSPAVSGSPAFSDVASDAYYAKAVKWAQANGITSGIGGGLFGSNDNCTRAQIVTFIYRYMEK